MIFKEHIFIYFLLTAINFICIEPRFSKYYKNYLYKIHCVKKKKKYDCFVYFLLSQYKFLAPGHSFSPPSPYSPNPIIPFQSVQPPWLSFFRFFSTQRSLTSWLVPVSLSSHPCFQTPTSWFQPAIRSFFFPSKFIDKLAYKVSA